MANLGLPEDVGATKVLGGTDPPDRQGILRSSPGKLLIKYTLEKLFLRPFYESFFINKTRTFVCKL